MGSGRRRRSLSPRSRRTWSSAAELLSSVGETRRCFTPAALATAGGLSTKSPHFAYYSLCFSSAICHAALLRLCDDFVKQTGAVLLEQVLFSDSPLERLQFATTCPLTVVKNLPLLVLKFVTLDPPFVSPRDLNPSASAVTALRRPVPACLAPATALIAGQSQHPATNEEMKATSTQMDPLPVARCGLSSSNSYFRVSAEFLFPRP